MSAEKTLYTKSFFNNIDLTEQCLTFPKIPRNEIYRESLIKHLSQMFSPERQVIMVEGIPASGKTTLLAQFARYFAKKSFSFFIGEDYLSSNYIRFQIDMCEQMKFWSRKNIQSISAENEQQLKTLFNFLYTDLIKEARHGNGPFYFVIDGIDLLHNDENNILNYLPKVQDNIYLLLSSNSPLKLNFPYDRWPIPPFSLEETEKYLNNYLKQEHIKKIFTISEGMPGYLAQIYREIQQGISVEEIINNIPLEFNQLLEKEWIRNNISEKNILDILAVVTFSPELVTIKELKDILEIDELKIRKIIKTISFIEEDSETQKIRFAMSAYKDFLESKLGDLRIEIDQKLIKYYEKNDGNENAFVHLPVLYKRTDNFSALGSLLSVDSLLNKFGTTKNTSFVRKNLRIYSGMAFNKKEWQRLSWSALAEAIFTSITTTPPTLENEIDALLALDNYTEALKHSCKCILPEDRLQLLARTFNYMRKKDIDISNDLVKILEDCVNQIDNIPDLSVDMVEKLLDACGYILPVHAKLALRIIERIISEKGTKEYNDNLMDFLVTKLLVTVGPEIDSTEDLESQITNESLRDFARAASSKVAGISEEKILEEVDQISDTSVKMFLLQSWCNTNSKNANAYKVIKEALRILTESVGYSPTQRQLRHLTKPLLNCENETETRELLKQIDILKATILQAPIDEYVRLELVLATIERKWSKKAAEERLYSVYFSLDEKVYDLDSRCHILIRILLSLPEIISDDERLKEEFEQQFKNEFEKLLKSSAEHFTATKKIFSALTIYNYNFALNYAAMLNTAYRRDLTYFEILKSYTDQRLENVEFDLINKALDKIENVLIRDRTLVQVIRRLSRKGSAISKQQKLIFYESVNNISTPTNKAYACAYYIRWIGDEDGKLIETLFFNLLGSLYSIDELWERVKAGFNLSRIIGDVKKDLAKILFEKTLNEKNKSIFFEERIIELYKNTCSIAIRMVPDVFKSVDYLDKINRIIQLIQTIPSSIEQCELLSSLALRCHTAGREDLFKKVTHICIDIIENVKNENVLFTQTENIGPVLFEYEHKYLFERIKNLPGSVQDQICMDTIDYILSKRPVNDHVDYKSLVLKKIEYPDVQKICEILEHMNTDDLIFSVITRITDILIEKAPGNKSKCILEEKQALTIAEKIDAIIKLKLPDPKNIQHTGYILTSNACLAKLRDSIWANQHRANIRWEKLGMNWEELKQAANSLENVADKIFVLATLGDKAYANEQGLATNFLKDAEKYLDDLTNNIDRADRFQIVAESYNRISNSEACQFLVNKTIPIINLVSQDGGRDQLMERLIELVNSIDPSLATSLATKIDDPMSKAHIESNLLELSLHSDPGKVEQNKKDSNYILGPACRRILTSFCSGKGTVQHDEVIAKWIYSSLGQDYNTIYLITCWFIENSIAKKQNINGNSCLESLFEGVLLLLGMIRQIGEVLNETASSSLGNEFSYPIELSNLLKFSVGQRDDALNTIKSWLAQNVISYVKIYDPYFDETELDILKAIPQQSRVTILTSLDANDSNTNIEDISSKYKSFWSSICNQVPPETHFFIFISPSRRTPMHNRYIVADDSGLELGTSLNGFGKRDSSIRFLEIEEKIKIENEFINSLIISAPSIYEGKPLTLRTFTLAI